MSDKEKLQKAQKLAEEHLAGWQKALADYQNLQKESAQKITDLKQYVLEDVVGQILPIFDNYYVAITHIPPGQENEGWAVGLRHILKMWESFLSENGITKIETVGQSFDPHQHEAVEKVHDADQPDNQVIKELQAGFKHRDRLLRPAKVVVNIIENK